MSETTTGADPVTPDILLARIAAPLRKFAHNLRHPLAAVAAMFAEPGEES